MSLIDDLPDDPDDLVESDHGVDVGRRDVLRSMGAMGLGLNATRSDVDLPGLLGGTTDTAAAQSQDPGWFVLHSAAAGDPIPHHIGADGFDDDYYTGHFVSTNHSVNYLGAQWVYFGDPLDGVGGCWKHTFVLSGLTAGVKDQNVNNSNLTPDFDVQNSTKFKIQTDADGLAISERRDRDLTGFISGPKVAQVLDDEIEVGDETYVVGDVLRDAAAAEDGYLGDYLGQTADDPTEEAKKDATIAKAGFATVGLAVGALFGPLGSVAGFGIGTLLGAAVGIIGTLVTDVEYQPREVPFTDGISATWESYANACGGGEFVTFDVFVSPDVDEASVTVESIHDVNVNDDRYADNRDYFRNTFDFDPEPAWEIEVGGEPHPDEMDEDDDPHNARIKRASAPAHVWLRDGRNPPVAEFALDPAPPTTTSGINLDASAAYAPDGEIVSYDWTLYASQGDAPPDLEPPGGDPRTATGETAHFEVLPGAYTVVLEIEDSNGKTARTIESTYVTNEPSVSVTADDTNPATGDVVTFTASADDPDGDSLTYYWYAIEVEDPTDDPVPRKGGDEWPTLDGDADTERTLTILDPDSVVDVTVTVVDHWGATASDTVTIEVQSESSPGNGKGNGGGRGGGNAGGGASTTESGPGGSSGGPGYGGGNRPRTDPGGGPP